MKKPCDELQPFICERDIDQQSIPLTVRCGNAEAPLSSTIITTTMSSSSSSTHRPPPPITTRTTITAPSRHPTVSFIQPPIVNEEFPPEVFKTDKFVQKAMPTINSEPIETATETRTSSIDPSKTFLNIFFLNFSIKFLDILAAVLGGIAIAIFSMNIIVCFMCKR